MRFKTKKIYNFVTRAKPAPFFAFALRAVGLLDTDGLQIPKESEQQLVKIRYADGALLCMPHNFFNAKTKDLHSRLVNIHRQDALNTNKPGRTPCCSVLHFAICVNSPHVVKNCLELTV